MEYLSFSVTYILLFWLTWWPFLRLLSLFITSDVGSLSSFPALMLPEEYLLSEGLFAVGVLLATQAVARWPVHMQCCCRPISSPDSLAVRIQEFMWIAAQVSYLHLRSHRRSQLENLSGLEACHQLWQWLLPPSLSPSPCFLRSLGHRVETPGSLGSRVKTQSREFPCSCLSSRSLSSCLNGFWKVEKQP